MRKLTALLLAVLLLFTLAACGGNEGVDSSAPDSADTSSESSAPMSTPDSSPDATTTSSGTPTTTPGRTRTTTSDKTSTDSSVRDNFVSTVNEKPYTGNAAILYSKQTSRFDQQAETKRQSILKEKDTVKATGSGKTYYISPKGDDANAGTSKDRPWRTTKNLQNHSTFKAGDAILFERGGVYRNVSVHLTSGVSYGAYGTGAKPCLYGSAQNYADKSLWKSTAKENVWRIKVSDIKVDIGNLVFDHGKQFGLKMLKNTLTVDYQFYHDMTKGYVYLYLAAGNPGEVYSDIELCAKNHILYTKGSYAAKDITIENLCIKYTGAHGIVVQSGNGMEAKNITVRGCEIGWIGGSMLDARVRYGNGIELNGGVDGALIEDNWIYQCYDAGYTNQGKPCYHKHIAVQDNLIEYNPYNIEVWTAQEIGKGGTENCAYKNNLLRFAGYGFGTLNRVGSNTSVVGNISFYDYVVPCKNTVITGNVFDCSYRYLVSIAYPNDTEGRGPTITGNTWNQKPYSTKDTTASVNRLKFNGTEILQSGTLDEMKTSVAKVDKAPVAVTLEN